MSSWNPDCLNSQEKTVAIDDRSGGIGPYQESKEESALTWVFAESKLWFLKPDWKLYWPHEGFGGF